MRLLIEACTLSAAVSMVMTVVLWYAIRGDASRRYASVVGFATGLLAAYARLEAGNIAPTSTWTWIPWFGLIGAIAGPMAIASGIHTIERWMFSMVFGLGAAWFLVPNRANLIPHRFIYLWIFAVAVCMLWNLLDLLVRRGSFRLVYAVIVATLLNVSVLAAYDYSLRIGAVGIVATAALAGGVLATLWSGDGTSLRGMLPSFCITMCGILVTAQTSGQLPKYSPLLILAAPITPLLFEAGPLSHWKGTVAVSAKCLLVGALLAAGWYF